MPCQLPFVYLKLNFNLFFFKTTLKAARGSGEFEAGRQVRKHAYA